ncbi:hypothetical protein [Porphyrobacter sp. ULC335]|jgi:hypothetical protein|uniref:hypothetical protein n=1 Tax=Porphyrobacter sp. ULC335 TaxID=2854260 RepID=UPI002220ABBE|nr:hypothetical protein [Porphyrobacter sp. ULC335]UYV16351.1 hypothetical protein KVF90_03175 [Porphyrobacter sp. ULC335]
MTIRTGLRLRGVCLLGLAAVTLAGCSAKWNTAFRDRPIPAGPSVITVDAKQRHVLIQPEFEPSPNPGEEPRFVKLRMCAEPAPDVFAAIATGGSGSLGVDAKSQSGEGAFGLSASETAASIERTQTINLLRESFFRTCERYLNGAISKESFIVQAGRDARAMVAVLAIEQLTGAVKPPATIISGPAVTANAQLSSELVTLYAAAAKRRDAAEAGFKGKEADLTADCTKGTEDEKKACDDKKKKATDAKAELDTANARVAEIVKLSGNVGQGTSALASTTAGTNQGGGGTEKPSPSEMAVVAGAVERIALKVIETDDMKLYCIERFARGESSDDSLGQSCLKLLARSADFEAAGLQADIVTLEAIRVERVDRFAAARGKLAANCTTTLKDQNLTPSELRAVCDPAQAVSIAAFRQLIPSAQERILLLLEEDS